MIKEFNNIKVNYIQYGNKEGKNVILLHGWGQNIAMMKPVGDKLSDDFYITIIDFPGFGESPEPLEPWKIENYTILLKNILEELNIINPIIFGHSFGGRVAICYAAENKTDKIILTGSPCIREQKKQPLKVRMYKKIKKIPFLKSLSEVMKNKIGSTDYKNATPIMRGTLVAVVNEDLTQFAEKIECPTLLIWGENDTAVPVELAKKMEKIIKDAGLVVLPGTHYAYLENLNHVITILRKFI